MKRAEIVEKLQAHQEEIKSRGVRSLAVFGSAAREDILESCRYAGDN